MWKKIISVFNSRLQSNEPLKNKHVLVVDDGQSERAFYSATLQKAGYTVDLASCAQEALDIICRNQKKPDVILMDFSMPDMNGNELCRRLKGEKGTADIPVIFLTGSTRPMDVVDCFDAGGEHFLTKPIDARCLIRQINTVLGDFECRRTFVQTLSGAE